jgi:hypothetical protein
VDGRLGPEVGGRALSVLVGLGLLRDADEPLDGVDKEEGDKDEGYLERVLDLSDLWAPRRRKGGQRGQDWRQWDQSRCAKVSKWGRQRLAGCVRLERARARRRSLLRQA